MVCAEMARVGEGKKVHQLEYVVEEQLLVLLSGKQRHLRLIPVRALDGDEVEWIKVILYLRLSNYTSTWCLVPNKTNPFHLYYLTSFSSHCLHFVYAFVFK